MNGIITLRPTPAPTAPTEANFYRAQPRDAWSMKAGAK